LGPKFRPSLPHFPLGDYIYATDQYIQTYNINPEEANNFRTTIAQELLDIIKSKHYTAPRSNLSPAEWHAISALKADPTIIIIPADKGNKTVVLDRDAYLQKLQDRISNHIKLKKDPTHQQEKAINQAFMTISKSDTPKSQKPTPKKAVLILDKNSIIQYKSQYSLPPYLKGQLKAHKPPEMPLREISDASQSPGHQLAKTLFSIFKDYTGNTKTFLKNGNDFINILKSPRFNKGGIFVSFDADKLYPSIVVPEALDILHAKLKSDKKLHHKTNLTINQLMLLTNLCTAEPYFTCELGTFQQCEGTPMGGPLSSLLADLVLENKIEATITAHPKWGKQWDWIRKADDTFMEWEGSQQDLDAFYAYLNTLHPTIKWTREIEENGKISFLDVQIIRAPTGIQTTVYRKPSASDRYTHFTTAQAWREKIITITTLRQRAETYCSTDELLTLQKTTAPPRHISIQWIPTHHHSKVLI